MAKQPKLCEVLATEKDVKGRAHAALTEEYRKLQKPDLFNGHAKTYEPAFEEGEQYPPESVRARESVNECLKRVLKSYAGAWATELTKDRGNMIAAADIIVDGRVLIEGAPVTFLLHIEKALDDLINVVRVAPTLDPVETWVPVTGTDTWHGERRKRARTQKVETAKVVIEPTEHQAGQYHIFTEDVTVGHWTDVKHSRALTEERKAEILEQCVKLLRATKKARERANSIEVKRYNAKPLLDFIMDVTTPDDTEENETS